MKAWNIGNYLCSLGLALGIAGPANADVPCSYNVAGVNFSTDGTLYANFTDVTTGSWHQWYFCNVSGTTSANNGTATVTVYSDTCKSWYSMFLTARASNHPVVFFFYNINNCASVPGNYITPNPFPEIISF